MPGESEILRRLADELTARSETRADSCVELSELSEVVQEADLGEDDAQALQDMLEARGIDVRDDCGRREVEQTTYVIDDLAQQTTDAMSLFLQEVRRYPLLTRDEEVELAQRIERGDLAAKEELVNSNLRLVISNARKFQGHDMPLLDLIQEGILGLIRAAEKFDWRKGYKFSTYATFWIRQALQRALDNRSRTIRIPVHLGQRERRIARAQRGSRRSWARADRRGGRRSRRAPPRRRPGGARDGPGRDEPRPPGGRGGADLARGVAAEWGAWPGGGG